MEARRMLVTILLFLTTHQFFSDALRCWVCVNQPSNEACIRHGHSRTCQKNEKSCQTSIRTGDQGISVTKRCKQLLACTNNQIQNVKAAWYPVQCNSRVPSSVCRCCCTFNDCNKPDLSCSLAPTAAPTTMVPVAPRASDEPTECPEQLVAPDGGWMLCDQGKNIGSVCSFGCLPGFDLTGSEERICGTNLGWSGIETICDEMTCPRMTPPLHGIMTCSDSNKHGSTCMFTCNSPYEIIGYENTTCSLTSTMSWSHIKPSCIRRTCGDVPSKFNLFFQCTDASYPGSLCTYTCLSEHNLIGPSTTECKREGNKVAWSNTAPTCEHIRCDHPGTIENGLILCPPDIFVNTVCYFSCNSEYYLNPSHTFAVCKNDTTFTKATPSCLPETCTEPASIPHGTVVCTNGSQLRSFCEFACEASHNLHGPQSATCLGGQWSSSWPACEKLTCAPQAKLANGSLSCTHQNNEGSVCSFECYYTHELVGTSDVQCISTSNNSAEWSDVPPICVPRKHCGTFPDEPEEGYAVCTDDIFIGSECEYVCNGFRRRVGNLYTTCTETGGQMLWDNPPPICERTQCADQGMIHNGTMTCTDGNFANSACSFNCSEDYTLRPSEVTVNRCSNDTTWDIPKPCCSRVCPPFARVDAVVLLDSSSSIGTENWRTMKSFIRQILDSFVVGSDAARLSVFRFNAVIDSRTQILLKDFPDDKEGFLRAYDRIPYDGQGTRTGAALTHALNVMLAPGNGNRPGIPDSVFVITDGVSQDHVTSAANKLRLAGVEVYAVGVVPPRGNLNRRQLFDIAGRAENLVIAEQGFDGLDQSLFDDIQRQICTEGCFEELV